MIRRTHLVSLGFVAAAMGLAGICQTAQGKAPQKTEKGRPTTVRDILWVWGNPEMVTPGKHTLSTFAQAGPAERAELLDVPNIIMAGHGLPNDDAEGERLTKEVSGFKRLVWDGK